MHIETWNMYFPEEELSVFNESMQIILDIKEILRNTLSDEDLAQIFESKIYHTSTSNLEKLVNHEYLNKNAGNALLCVSCAISELLYGQGYDHVLVRIRITTLHSQSRFGDIDSSNLGKVVFMMGTICRVGFKRISCSKMFFECGTCKEMISIEMKNNIYKQPRKCKGMCKSRIFNLIHSHPDMQCRDVQEIKIQELCGYNGNDDVVSIPKVIDCIIYDEFVGTLVPGDIVQAVGVLGVELESGNLYKLVVQVNNLQVVKNKNFFVDSLEYRCQDFFEFKRIAKTEDILASFMHSLYPTIYGNELIKAGLILGLFGGTRKQVGQCSVRSEIHLLIIGDPGLGKSRMLLNTCNILPKSSYVSGNFTTTAGLTVSLTHDPVSGEYMADAGALVVADNGICCLDEFDKIDDHAALFEAMEDQKVTVAKGGVICSVPTRTSIIAATNPKHGHFDQSKTVTENLRFDSALLSRFDLIFVLLDNLSEKESYEISGQIIKRRQSVPSEEIPSINPITDIMSVLREDKFIENLKREKDNVLYTMDILRKYISYARASVFPTLSRGAKETVKKYYLSIRHKPGVTTRDLESLIRLTEARAKVELRSIATKADAMFCIEIYKRILISEEKICKPKKNSKDFTEVLREHTKKESSDLISNDELCRLITSFDSSKSVSEFIEMLNYKGLIIKKGANIYKILG